MDIIRSMEDLTVHDDNGAIGYTIHTKEHHHDQILNNECEIFENISNNKLCTNNEPVLDVEADSALKSPNTDLQKNVETNEGLNVNESKSNDDLRLSKFADTYKLEKFKQNLLIIFNHMEVFGHEDREGTDKDVEKLTETFEALGFIVVAKTDLTRDEIHKRLDELNSKNFNDYGCVAVAVLTHGIFKDKFLLGTKSYDEYYTEADVIARLKMNTNRTLKQKPKIVIIQACRGEQSSKGIVVGKANGSIVTQEEDKFYNLPVETDMLVIHSTYAGNRACRTRNGSWLIQTLCSEIASLAYIEDLESILVHVKRKVVMKDNIKYNKETEKNEVHKQMPVITSTLTRKLHLRKYQEQVLETLSHRAPYCDLQRWAEQRTHHYTDVDTEHMSGVDTLENFMEFASIELDWLSEKEQVELSRDWADPHINLPNVQHYYEYLMTSLENREVQFKHIIKLGEALIAQDQIERKTIDTQLQKLKSQWAWVLQLTLCLEMHLKYTTEYYKFFEEVARVEKTIKMYEEELNNNFSQLEITPEANALLLQRLFEILLDLIKCREKISKLETDTIDIRPVKQRKTPVIRSFKAETVCDYKYANVNIKKDSIVNVIDNSDINNWRVCLDDDPETEVLLPSAMVAMLPKNHEAVESASRLKMLVDRVWQLFDKKQARCFQSDLFLLVNQIKGWGFSHLIAMGAEERQSHRQNLNDGANRLRELCNVADPRLRRLFSEVDEVNKLFDESDRRDPAYCMKSEEGSKNAAVIFPEQSSNLLERLMFLEKKLCEEFARPIPRDPDALEHLTLQLKDWKGRLLELSKDVKEMNYIYKAINLKTPTMKMNFNNVTDKWNELQSNSQKLEDMLTLLNTVVNSVEENHQTIYEFESELAHFNDLSNHLVILLKMYEPLQTMKEKIADQQTHIDEMRENFEKLFLLENLNTALPQSPSLCSYKHKNLESLKKEISQQENRWINVRRQLTEISQSCDAACRVLSDYSNGLQKQETDLESISCKFNQIENHSDEPLEEQPVWELLTNIIELTPEIEKVNVNGGRFIQEAQIHASRCQCYVKWLCEEIHQSWNIEHIWRQAEVNMAEKLRSIGLELDTERLPTGSEAVAKALDELNDKHQKLLDTLYAKLKTFAVAFPEDMYLVQSMMPQPARSFCEIFKELSQNHDKDVNDSHQNAPAQDSCQDVPAQDDSHQGAAAHDVSHQDAPAQDDSHQGAAA